MRFYGLEASNWYVSIGGSERYGAAKAFTFPAIAFYVKLRCNHTDPETLRFLWRDDMAKRI
jgi:hypothetical protein